MEKKKKKKSNSNLNILLILCFIVIMCMIIITIVLEKNKSTTENISDEQISIDIQKQLEEEQIKTEDGVIISKLMNMEERDRIEYYFSRFIDAVESSSYDKAYEMLYDEYKKNYFPSLSEFEKYAKETFPSMMSVKHTNFERSGDVYVLFVTISDSLSYGNENEMRFVIKENSYNDFTMSFSVI